MSDAMQSPRADDYCYVTTTGRRTGRPHRIEIWYADQPGGVYLLAGGGQSSDWVRNIVNYPAVLVEINQVMRRGRGRIADVGGEANRARSRVFAKYAPRSSSDLSEWRDRAIPIVIDFELEET